MAPIEQKNPTIVLRRNKAMIENTWFFGFRVFMWGVSGVFLGLIILMYCVKLMSALILKLEVKKRD